MGMKMQVNSLNKYLLSMFYMLSIVLGIGDTSVNKTDPWPHGVYILSGVRDGTQTGK